MIDIVKQELIQNVYAKNVEQIIIHISEAKSGRQGYFCLGCDRPMQAVKQSKIDRISYFRHDHNASAGEAKCTYSDETYRHKIAKEYLINFKKVKVPSLYKYPAKGTEGIANLIFKEKYIEASFGMPELSFYEDENGEIHYEKLFPKSENNFLLLRPDITFFDSNAKPILLIELIATHKLTEEKKLRLKRLGIDTIQITIPKDSPESIEHVFEKTNRTKWIYNYEQENAEYIPIPIPDSEGVSSIDEDQRKLFEESYKCRTAQIGNLIRTIKRCVESEQYRTIADDYRSEISRVARNSEAERADIERIRGDHKLRIEALREGIREKVDARYQSDIDTILSERAKLNAEEQQLQEFISKEEAKFASGIEEYRNKIEEQLSKQYPITLDEEQRRYRELEERYQRKKSEIIRKGESNERVIRQSREAIDRLELNVTIKRRDIERERREINFIEEQITKESSFETDFQNQLQSIDDQIRRIEKENRNQQVEDSARIESDRNELTKRYQYFCEQFIAAIEGREFEENEYTRRYKEQIVDMERIPDYINAKQSYDRYEKAWRCFTEGTYENWHE